MRWWAELRERVRTAVFRDRVYGETQEEMAFHIDMETAQRIRDGVTDPAEARRQATMAFGGVDKHAEAVRDRRGFGPMNGMSLDVKLGGRMLRKYPGLTLAGGLALTLAVALGASFFEFTRDMTDPKLTLPDAQRIVTVQNMDLSRGGAAPRSLHDFEAWREGLQSLEHLAAIVQSDVSLVTDDGSFASVRGARMHAAAFHVAGVEPLLGRTFTEADEQKGAETPALIGYGVWQKLFGGDRGVLGRTLKVGSAHATVIGVMPEGFGFPTNHEVWIPLRERASDYERGAGPVVMPVARLRRGADLSQAQAEMDIISERLALAHPETNEHTRAQVKRVADAIGMSRLVYLINVPFIFFLVVVCANIATLVFARTVARSGELALRSALGASRKRLVLQLIAESLVLTSTATVIGLVVANYGRRYGMAIFWEVQQMAPPFWFRDSISPITIGYAILLSIVAASIIGGIPALKATGIRLRHRLAEDGAGGAGMRFGRVSTAVIVAQVALCVIFLPVAFINGKALLPSGDTEAQFPARDFLSGRIVLESEGKAAPGSPEAARRSELYAQIKQRLAAEPGVIRAALVTQLPGFNHGVIDFTFASDTAEVRGARFVGVDPDWFDVVNARISAGRAFAPGEYESGARVLVVDAAWAAEKMPNRNLIGETVLVQESGDARPVRHEIVGIVDGVGPAVGPGENVAMFHPLTPDKFNAGQVYVRTSQPPVTMVPQIHAAVTAIDDGLSVDQLQPLDQIWAPVLRANVFFIGLLNVIVVVIMGFALVGIYALMSFTVARRTREIAIRTALGAEPRNIVTAIFARAALQIGLGIVIGAAIISIAIARSASDAALVASVSALMLVMGLAGCGIPVRRALRVHPTAALRSD